jgi:hypothetical protein
MVRLFVQRVSHGLVPTLVKALRARVISNGPCGSHLSASLSINTSAKRLKPKARSTTYYHVPPRTTS